MAAYLLLYVYRGWTGAAQGCVMYAGLCSLDTLHKTIRCIGPRLYIMLEVNFQEILKVDVRRIYLLRLFGK
jgi:hypothetical protein